MTEGYLDRTLTSSQLEPIPAFMLNANDFRNAAPYPTYEDFSEAVLATAANEKLLSEIRWVYMNSEEIATLYKTFDVGPRTNRPVHRALQLTISSSRKYTRFKFPHCPKLVAAIHWILRRHKCQAIGHDHCHDLEIEITVPRLGAPYEVHEHEIEGLEPD